MIPFDTIDPHRYIRLANAHINHYNRLIFSGARYVRVAECQMFIHIWESVLAAKGVWADIATDGRTEIRDAAYSREYDDILGITDENFDE